MPRSSALVVCLLAFGSISFAQQRQLGLGQTYERVYAAVPMTGQGTWGDPRRPMFAPVASQMKSGDRSGVIAFHYVLSDDGKTALVEFVFQDRAALRPVVSSLSVQPSVKTFDRAKDSGAAIEAAFKAFKKDFDLSAFSVRVP